MSVSTVPTPFPAYKLPDDSKRMFELDAKQNAWDNSGKSVLYQNPQAAYIRTSTEQIFTFAPSSFVAGPITTLQQTQFRIPRGSIDGYFEYVDLLVKITETGGANSVTVAAAPYLLSPVGDAIQTGFNGGGTVQHSIPADALYLQFQHMTPAQIQNAMAANQANMSSTTYQTPTAIPAGGSAYYVIPLPMHPIIGLSSRTLTNGDIVCYFNWNNTGGVFSGSGTATVSSVTLRVYTHKNSLIDDARNSLISSDVYVKNMCRYALTSVSAVNLAAGVQTQIQLQGLAKSIVGAMAIMIRSSKSGSNIMNFLPLCGSTGSEFDTQIDVQNSSGKTILGRGAISGAVSRYTLQQLESNGVMSTQVPIYWVYFSARPAAFIANADCSAGMMPLDNNFYLYLTPSGNFAAGQYYVDVLFYALGSLKQNNGNIEVLNTV